MTRPTILKFALTLNRGDPRDLFGIFYPKGHAVLNRTSWRGKEPRSCSVTRLQSRPSSGGPLTFDIEVSYRPRGYITFVGQTKYDGWTAMVLDRKRDGTLLDGHGQPLPEGKSPVYLPYEVFHDIEFNEIEFGDFIEEVEVQGIKRLKLAEVYKKFESFGGFSAGILGSFVVSRRHRPEIKIILTNVASNYTRDAGGTKIIMINGATPQLPRIILDHLTEAVSGFMEGRYTISNISGREMTLLQFSDVFVDCRPNEEGKESRFHCLNEYVSDRDLEELAKQLCATYKISIDLVESDEGLAYLIIPDKGRI